MAEAGATLRRMALKYDGKCANCGRPLTKGEKAFYDASVRKVFCEDCALSTAVIDAGVAGRSAMQKHEQLLHAREARVKGRWGNFLGGVALAVSEEPREIRTWETGARGEQKLAQALNGVKEVRSLHDRKVPHTQGNIDHLLVAPGGVFVVDAKLYKGLIQVRDVGGWFNSDKRLYVGRRDCSQLAEGMGWQMAAVGVALLAAKESVPLHRVLCFVDGQWPLLFPPKEYKGVWLESKGSLKKRVMMTRTLDESQIERVWKKLGLAFPAK